jgi:hypothetical protein
LSRKALRESLITGAIQKQSRELTLGSELRIEEKPAELWRVISQDDFQVAFLALVRLANVFFEVLWPDFQG